jgi:6-pyruvoyl-tetrahydropterin synthase
MEKVDLLNTKSSDYDQKVLNKGKNVEKEHTTSEEAAKTITKQHMAEFPKKKNDKISSDYYEELEKLENKLKKKLKNKETFEDIVSDVVKENSMSSGSGSVFGVNAGDGSTWNGGFSGDTYATGDSRNLFGIIQSDSKKGKRKGKRKKKSKIIRRTFPNM